MKECIFCDIVNRKEKAKILFEDKKTLCFLDASPISKGHCLIITKKHCKNILDIPKKELENVIATAQKVAKKTKADGFNILHASGKDAQQSINHFHIHLVPRNKGDKLDLWFKKKN
jgi:histidine triad (HIT) family protein